MKYIVTNVKWDIDYNEDGDFLPTELTIDVPESVTDVEEFISDKLSDITGYCHEGFAVTPEIV